MSLEGKTVLVTGGNTGIGRATAAALAAQKARVFLACRSRDKALPVVEALRAQTGNPEVHFHPLDLADLAATRDSAKAFLARGEPLHVLVNNAGLVRVPGVTKQGFEPTFGVNHLGHFLFTQLLRPALEAGAPARVVVVASRAHAHARALDFEAFVGRRRSLTGWPEYQASKLCNVLFSAEAARRWGPDKVHFYAVHPGVIASDIWRIVPWPLRPLLTRRMRTVEEGCRASVRCASSPDVAAHTGLYYDEDGGERPASSVGRDAALAGRLWEKSLEWVKPFLDQAAP